MTGWAIVALPEKDDPVNKVSSEEMAHMTLLFLGEPPAGVSEERIALFLQHATETLGRRFGASVDRRGTLGPDEADVLFFETRFMEDIVKFREHLLQQEDIQLAYQSTEQYPSWTPHLTLGYPDAPAHDVVENPIRWVSFDRIALWTGEFDGPEFVLKEDDRMALDHSGVDSFLAHYGIKGMKWGVRRKRGADGRVKKEPAHEDATQAKATKARISTSGTDAVSNADLRKLNERLQLERSYAQLTTQQKQPGRDYVKTGLLAGKRMNEVIKFAQSPAGQAIALGLGSAATVAVAKNAGNLPTAPGAKEFFDKINA